MAFLVVILIPIVLIYASLRIITIHQMNSIEKDYGVDIEAVDVVKNPIQLLNRATKGVYSEIRESVKSHPEDFENEENLAIWNDKLSLKHSFLMVRKGNEYVYCGNEEMANKIEGELPTFGSHEEKLDGGIYIGGKTAFLVKLQEFYYRDGEEGTVFIVTGVNNVMPQIKWFMIQVTASILLVILITAIALVLWIYSGIVKPLNKLRRATFEIREGNLDYEIKEVREDEIGQLCSDFEEMRIRLRELIEVQLKNERNSKELFSNISHDLKTPLTAIKGYAEGIMDGVADTKEKQERYLRTIHKKAADMTVLVDELLYYTKIDANSISYNFTKINLTDYFEDCIDEYRLDAKTNQIKIEFQNHLERNTQVVADPEQIKRVVDNIIGNSVKYMSRENGTITVCLDEMNEDVKIEISDNGVGIAEKDLPHIFDRFYRADASRNSKKGGSGLGLAIAKKIIEDHGGMIWADSKEGQGTSTGFTLKKVMEEAKNE